MRRGIPGIAVSGPLEVSEDREPQRLAPIRCRHREMSEHFILRAARASATPPRTAIVIGGGACREIPLVPLARDLESVVVTDIDPSALERLAAILAATGMADGVRYRVEDISGATERLLREADACIESSILPGQALAGLIDLVDSAEVTPPTAETSYDLVVASCVVTQIHVRLQREMVARFRERFPLDGGTLEGSSEWLASMTRLVHRMQDAFFASVAAMMHQASVAYISATVQVGALELLDDGAWQCPGWYRTMRHQHLLENLGATFDPRYGGDWPWVVHTPTAAADGLLYRVQAVIASLGRASGQPDT